MNEQNNLQQNESIQNPRNIWIIILSVIITALVIGGGVYIWENSNSKSTEQSLKQQIILLQNQIESLKSSEQSNNPTIQPSQEASDEQDITVTTEGISPISIIKTRSSCKLGYEYSNIKILKDDSLVGEITISSCDSVEGKVLAVNDDSAYFTITYGSWGGYILYGGYFNLYKVSFSDNSLRKIFDLNSGTEIDFSKDLSMLVYSDSPSTTDDVNEKIILQDLDSGREKSYIFSKTLGDGQLGDFEISPNKDKVAFAVGYGPGNEHGEIYVLNFEDESFNLYKETKTPPAISGWIDNDNIDWKD